MICTLDDFVIVPLAHPTMQSGCINILCVCLGNRSRFIRVQVAAGLFSFPVTFTVIKEEGVVKCLRSTEEFESPPDLESDMKKKIRDHELFESVDIHCGRIVVGLSETGKEKVEDFSVDVREDTIR